MMEDTAAHAYDNYKGLTEGIERSWILKHSRCVWGFSEHNVFHSFFLGLLKFNKVIYGLFHELQGDGEPILSFSIWVSANIQCFCDSCFT